MNVFKNMCNFKGKSTRSEFLTYVFCVCALVFFTKGAIMSVYDAPIVGVLCLLIVVLMLLPFPALITRRFNDTACHFKKWGTALVLALFTWVLFGCCAQFLLTKYTLIYNICAYTSIAAIGIFALIPVILLFISIFGNSKED